ncbi:MAG TPA: hypothetical protein VJ324_11200 [Candidatus Acidoferrum sp.]|nr:hypothetical protein [Candidatus Acidoferrum sp.]
MNTLAKRESLPAVTAAGVVAIIFSALGLLLGLLVEASMIVAPRLRTSEGVPGIPPGTLAAVEVFWLFGVAIAIFGFFAGLGVLRRRNWARITMLVWGGIMAVLSAVSIPVILLVFNSLPSSLPNGAEAGPFMGFLKVFMVFFYGIPLGIGIWWLVLFTRPRVAAAFAAPAPLAAYPPAMDATGFPLPQPEARPSSSSKAACPLPLMILAGFLIFSAACMVLAVLFPMTGSMPFFLFGHLFSGISAKFLLGLIGVVLGIAGVGMLKLKPAALHTVLVLQCVFFINGILSAVNPRFLAAAQEAMQRADAENPAFPGGNPFLTGSFFHSILIFGLFFSAAIIAILLFYRSRFLEAASAANA